VPPFAMVVSNGGASGGGTFDPEEEELASGRWANQDGRTSQVSASIDARPSLYARSC
jgi:hypothetical protein